MVQQFGLFMPKERSSTVHQSEGESMKEQKNPDRLSHTTYNQKCSKKKYVNSVLACCCLVVHCWSRVLGKQGMD